MTVERKEYTLKSLNELISFSTNPKKHSEYQIDMLANYIKNTGFIDPIVIDENDMVLAGHCRIFALMKLDRETVDCIKVYGLSEQEKKAYVIADNKLSEMGSWDNQMLQEEVLELLENDYNIADLGFNNDDIEAYKSLLNDDNNYDIPDNSNDENEYVEKDFPNMKQAKVSVITIKIDGEILEDEHFKAGLKDFCSRFGLMYSISHKK